MLPLRSAAPVLTLVALAALTGCGSKADPPLSETLPACDDLWVAGTLIPDDYSGCREADGVLTVPEVKECTKNDHRLTTYGTQFYGMLGQQVHDDGVGSPGYSELYLACFGESW